MIAPQTADAQFAAKQQIVKRLAGESGLYAIYAEQSSCDIERSVKLLKTVDFCIADLSYERPSCYYEVGFAQSMGKTVELIAQHGTPLHQVLNQGAVRYYQDLQEYENLVAFFIASFRTRHNAARSRARLTSRTVLVNPARNRV